MIIIMTPMQLDTIKDAPPPLYTENEVLAFHYKDHGLYNVHFEQVLSWDPFLSKFISSIDLIRLLDKRAKEE